MADIRRVYRESGTGKPAQSLYTQFRGRVKHHVGHEIPIAHMMMGGDRHSILQSTFFQRFHDRSDPFVSIPRVVRAGTQGRRRFIPGRAILSHSLERDLGFLVYP